MNAPRPLHVPADRLGRPHPTGETYPRTAWRVRIGDHVTYHGALSALAAVPEWHVVGFDATGRVQISAGTANHVVPARHLQPAALTRLKQDHA